MNTFTEIYAEKCACSFALQKFVHSFLYVYFSTRFCATICNAKKNTILCKKHAQTKQKIITQQMFPLFLVEIFAFTFMNCPCDFCTGEICRYPYISKLASVQLFVYYLVYLDSIKPASIKCLLQLISCGF